MRFIPAVSLVRIQLQPPSARWSRGLRHRPFTAVTRVRISSGSPVERLDTQTRSRGSSFLRFFSRVGEAFFPTIGKTKSVLGIRDVLNGELRTVCNRKVLSLPVTAFLRLLCGLCCQQVLQFFRCRLRVGDIRFRIVRRFHIPIRYSASDPFTPFTFGFQNSAYLSAGVTTIKIIEVKD